MVETEKEMKSRRATQLEEAEAQNVERIVKVLWNGEEHFSTGGKQLTMPERGDIAFHQVLHQVMDGANVIALNLTIGSTTLTDIRRVDKKLEERVGRLVRRAGKGSATPDLISVHIRLDSVIG